MSGSHELTSAKNTLIGVKELAEYLGISEASVYRLVERRLIRYHKLPRHLRFRWEDVEVFLAQCLVKPVHEYEHSTVR